MVHLLHSIFLMWLFQFATHVTSLDTNSQWVDPQSYSPRLLSNRRSDLSKKTSVENLSKHQTSGIDSNAPRVSMLAFSQTKLKPANEKLKTSKLTVPINVQQQLQYRQKIQNHLEKQEQQNIIQQQQQLQQQQLQQQQLQQTQQNYLTQLRHQSIMQQARANNIKDSSSRGHIQSLKAKNRNKPLKSLSATRKFDDLDGLAKQQRKQDYLRPSKYYNNFDTALPLSRRDKQLQLLQQQQQQQMIQSSMNNYPLQLNYPQQTALHTLGMSLNPNRMQQQSTPTDSISPSQQQQSSLVRLSNLQSLDLLKRKKPTNHVLAALRQSKINDDTDLISEAGRLSRRAKTFKFQFEKSKNKDKIEIEGNGEASLVNNNSEKNNDEENVELVVAREENAPAVVLIKKTSNPTSSTTVEPVRVDENTNESIKELTNLEKTKATEETDVQEKEAEALANETNDLKETEALENEAIDSRESEAINKESDALTKEAEDSAEVLAKDVKEDALENVQHAREDKENFKTIDLSIQRDSTNSKETTSEITSEIANTDNSKTVEATIPEAILEENSAEELAKKDEQAIEENVKNGIKNIEAEVLVK